MRIISKFKDYYDSAMGQGIDVNKIFNRNEEILTYPDNLAHQDFPKIYRCAILGKESTDLESFIVLFAGKPYGCIRYYHSSEVEVAGHKWPVVRSNAHYCYTMESFLEVCGMYKFDLKRLDKNQWRKGETPEVIFNLSSDNQAKLQKFALDNKISTAIVGGTIEIPTSKLEVRSRTSFRDDKKFVINPCLKDIQFYQVLDAFTAYQELDMWISGVLASNPEPVSIADRFKIAQHGFDKYSFRKLPTTK